VYPIFFIWNAFGLVLLSLANGHAIFFKEEREGEDLYGFIAYSFILRTPLSSK